MAHPDSPALLRPPPTRWEWVQVILLVANLGWTTLCLGGFRAETMAVTIVLTGFLVAAYLCARVSGNNDSRQPGSRPAAIHPAGLWLLPFLIYAAGNVLWITPVAWLGWRDWFGWAQMVTVFWVALNGIRSGPGRRALVNALVFIAVVSALVAVYQHFENPSWLMMGRTQAVQFIGRASGPFGIPNSLGGLLVLILPIVLARSCRPGASGVARVFFGYISAILVGGLVLTISRGAWISLGIVLVIAPMFVMRGGAARRVGWAMAIVVAMTLFGAALFSNLPLVHDRLVQLKTDAGERSRPILWRAAWTIFQQHPVTGGGAGSYNVLFDRHRPATFQDEPLWAHNEYLNTLSDYGAVGFVLFFGACGVIAWRCGHKRQIVLNADWLDEPWVVAGLIAGIAAFALQLGVDFHFKIPALAMAFAAISGLVVQGLWPVAEIGHPQWRFEKPIWLIAASGIVVVVIFVIRPTYQSEALRVDARRAVDRAAAGGLNDGQWALLLRKAHDALAQSVKLDPKNGSAWADLSYVLALQLRFDPHSDRARAHEALEAADRALACSPAVAEFWVWRGVARDAVGSRADAESDYARAVELAPTKPRVWYYQAAHYAVEDSSLPRAREALATSLRLDPFNPQAHALFKRLAARGLAH